MQDRAYAAAPYVPPTLSHRYGAHVHVLHDPLLLTELGRLSAATTPVAEVPALVRTLYRSLWRQVLAARWPQAQADIETRMRAVTERGVWRGPTLAPGPDVVVVDIARAGTVPAQLLYEETGALFGGERVRQDHLTMGRKTDLDGRVTGVATYGVKRSGPAAGAWVVVPDPMGATGTSMVAALAHYRNGPEASSRPARLLALHLIVTPEYLACVTAEVPELEVWAVRLDRGMSDPDVLNTRPGTRWADERGLNAHDYIVPGAGGLGELLNNADA